MTGALGETRSRGEHAERECYPLRTYKTHRNAQTGHVGTKGPTLPSGMVELQAVVDRANDMPTAD